MNPRIVDYLAKDRELLERIKAQKPLMFGTYIPEISELTRKKLENYRIIQPRQNPYEAFIKSQIILSQLIKNPNA